MGTKVSAATALLPLNRASGDYIPVDDGVIKQKLDVSLLGAYTRLNNLTPYTSRAAALAGTSSNNSATTGAIVAQLLTFSAAGGGVALIDPGFYLLTAYLPIPSNVILRGAGKNKTTLVVANQGAFTSDGDAYGAVLFSGVNSSSVQDLTIDTSGTSGQDGIVFKPLDIDADANTVSYTSGAAGTHFSEGEVITGGTSGATAVVEKCLPSSSTAGKLWLYDVVGTIASGEVITGNKVGSATTSTVLTNPNAFRCSAVNVEVLGQSMNGLQYLIWSQNCVDIDVIGCTVNGNSIKETPRYTITAATAANPSVFTVGTHAIKLGQKIVPLAMAGGTWASANGQNLSVTAVSATTVTVALDASGYGTYTGSTGNTGGREWYATGAGNVAIDQEGIEIRGGRRNRVLNNTCINILGPGIGIPEVNSPYENQTTSCVVEGNVINRCGYGFLVTTCYSTANGLKPIDDLVIANNTVKDPWYYAIHYYHGAVQDIGLTIPWTAQSVAIVAGLKITGNWSKATAIVRSTTGSAGTGTLTVYNIQGRFVAGETITDSGTGSVTAGTPAKPVMSDTVARNIVISNNTCSGNGSVKDANHANMGLFITNTDVSGAAHHSGCVVINNSFSGFGGGLANQFSHEFLNAHDWVISGNTFDADDLTGASYLFYIYGNKRLRLLNNIIRKSPKSAILMENNTALEIRGNIFDQWATRGAQDALLQFNGGSSGIVIASNIFDSSDVINKPVLANGVSTDTGVTINGNSYVGSAYPWTHYLIPWATDTITTGSTGTITHSFGTIKPSAAAGTFTLTATNMVTVKSRVLITQIAGTATAIKAVCTLDTVVFTATAAFDGAVQFQYEILN